ncbi:MAG: hypothetical protein CMK09_16620 [Ponticaulis sp.]|nr:hypothetical protein [Ponticaulis sp.]|tara:strand:- start:13748 stop:14011 length:264 start_codon:yes stop_codon:yes gene_type:complete
MLKRGLILVGTGFGFVLAALAVIQFSGVIPPVEMSGHGWFAFLLGAGLCIILSVGLFALAFFSNRAGYDEISDPSTQSDEQIDIRIG